MIRYWTFARVTLVWFILLGARPAAGTIEYRVSLERAADHVFDVTMVAPVEGNELVVAIPAWNALYQVRDFAYRLRELQAGSADDRSARCPLFQMDKQTWRISDLATCSRADDSHLKIRYAIEWDDAGPFNSELDLHHAFINLAEILMYLPDRRQEDTVVEFVDLPSGWHTAVELAGVAGLSTDQLSRVDAPSNAYAAASYDALVDAPVEVGKFENFHFTESGARFRVVVDADVWSRERLEEGLRRITHYELGLMGGPPFDPPSREYTFFFHIGPYADVGGGGMEHRNCTVIAASSVDNALVIAAHEFFHVWNVKRIRPQSLEPVDYTKEQHSRALWFAEGVTSCYASFALERSGLWTKNQFYDDLASQIGNLQSRAARLWQSVEESSFDAWFEKYDGYNTPDRSISYYNKGQIVGVLLDLEIRDATDNHKSLDDVFRLLYEQYALQGKFYNDSDGIRAAVEEVAGKSFEDFFSKYVSGLDEIPYEDFLSIAGLELRMDPGKSPNALKVSEGKPLILEIARPTDRQRRIREGILHGSTD
jgi:predicted metalloprotease with PDZ domain